MFMIEKNLIRQVAKQQEETIIRRVECGSEIS